MAVSREYLAYLLEQLSGLGQVRSRRMFGGAGLYCDEVFFGIISDDTLYLRVADAHREDFTSRGMQPFRPYADRPQVSMTYFEVPADVLEDSAQLLSWGRRSVASALQKPKSARARKVRVPRASHGKNRSAPRLFRSPVSEGVPGVGAESAAAVRTDPRRRQRGIRSGSARGAANPSRR